MGNDTDPEGLPLNIQSVDTVSQQGGMVAFDSQTGEVTYTPAAHFNGADSFTYTIEDDIGNTAVGTVNVTVDPVNDLPEPVSDTIVGQVGVTITITTIDLLANDIDPDGETLTLTSVQDGNGGTASIDGNGDVVYTPDVNSPSIGTFTYTVTNTSNEVSTSTVYVTSSVNTVVNEGTSADDTINGGVSSDFLSGQEGADIIIASSGDDILVGGMGVDVLDGDSGDDTYRFNLGDGQDTINEDTGTDVIELGPGITETDLVFSKTSTHLIVSITGTSDSIQITKQYHADTKFHVEILKLDDGTEIDLTGPLPLTGTNGNVTLYGNAGDDTLISADGIKIYRGEKGDDTYDYTFGAANDTLVENTGDDTLSFGSGVSPDDVQIVQTNNHLDITLKSTGVRLRINNQFNANNKYWVETLVFADGTLWDLVNGVQAGTTGDDTLTADAAGEVVFANGGNDVLTSGAGNDELHGGDGDDEYQFGASQGDDLVRDSGGVDKIVLAAGIGLADISMAQVGDNLVVTLNTGETLTVHEHYLGAKSVETLVFADGMTLDLTKNNVIGTASAETLNGSASEDVMYGFAGDDTLTAGDGADWLDGGAGNDQLDGGGGNDTYFIASGEGNDTIIDSGGADLIQLGPGIALADISAAQVGDDLVLTVTATSQTITIVNHYHATLGPAERVESLRFDDGVQVDLTVPANEIGNSTTITGGSGDDTFTYTIGDGSFTIEDAGGADKITLDGTLTDDDFSVSKSGNNLLITIATTGDVITVTDHFNAGTGSTHKIETLEISGGSVFDITPDILEGTAGDDTLTGTGSEQNIFGLDGNDVLTGQNSVADWIIGGAGDDNIDAKSGNDLLYGNAGDDTLTGGGGHDYSYGGAGEDLIKSGGGNDYAYGGADDDDIRAGGGHDFVYGEDGDDNLRGDGGNDQLFGGDGADFLDPGKGTDTITGGAGIDTYNFDKEDEFDGDVITDFVAGVGGEALDLAGLFNAIGYSGTTPVADGYIAFEQSGSDTLVKLDPDGGGDGYTSTLTLQNVTAANIVDENIIS